MNAPYNQEIWEKRTLYGYHPEYVKKRFEEMERDFLENMQRLDREIEKNEMRRKALLEEAELKRFIQPEPEADLKPTDEKISRMLFQKHMEVTGKLVEIHHGIDEETKQLKEIIAAKKEERDFVLLQLKEGLQQLHATFSRSRGV
ncbi:MAG: hypothetical protein Q8906_10960 [Bacillota bacterium]|nr:hypothetical protein [Bacillota bacterium]